jgi:glycosyltransferase involved in cell wall biosynthesis
MKILFDASPMIVEQTGIAFYTERLATGLAAAYPDELQLHGFYYNFLGRRDTAHLPIRPNLGYMGASLLPSKIVYQLRRWGIEIPIELLSLTRADFILYPNIIGYPSLFKTPSAPVIHDLTYIDLPEYVSAKLRSDLIRFVPRTIKRAAFVVTVSEFTKQRIVDYYGVPAGKIIVTPIPPEPVRPVADEKRAAILEELGITKPYILFVGTIEPRKNVPNLIDGFLKLPEALRGSHQLVIAGRIGWNCETEVAKLGQLKEAGNSNVVHLGYVSNEARDVLYQSATLFTSASHYEGFGMPVLEAMNYGVPCVLSDIPIFNEVAEDAAYYFDQDDPANIALKLTEVLENPAERERLSEKALTHVKKYSWDKVAATVHDAIVAHTADGKPNAG